MSVSTIFIFICSTVILLLVKQGSGQAQGWTATPFNPPCLPLAVRSPYHNAWLNQGPKSDPLNKLWPNLWTPHPPTVVGWTAAVQVDNVTYSILGNSPVWPNTSTQVSSEFTPTRTIFNLTAGPVNVVAAFLSPVNPTDLVRLSLPYSYFYMNITANDGKTHHIRVYSDISGEWVSGSLSSVIDWSATNENGVVTLQTHRQTIAGFSEINDHAEDVTAYHSTLQQPGVSFKIAQDSVSRGQFVSDGVLDGGVDNNFRAISSDFPVFALSVDLGNITQTTSPIVWGLGLFRDPAIQYTTSDNQVQLRSSYFWSQYPTPSAAISFSLGDFENALNNATALDAQINADAIQYSSSYADLVALTMRQALGPLEITLSKDSNGDWNTSDIKIFMKNLGSGSGSINEVDVLYAAFPSYLYLNPQLGKYLLAPLLEFQESPAYTNSYAAQNLGLNYPNATGNTAPHNLEIEESANMLIMVLAHVQATGDSSLLIKHYNLLKKWADYLVQNALSPNSQITGDDLVGTNQTNLALKGIIAIAAMAKISRIANDGSGSIMYQNVSSSYITQWEALSTSAQGSLLADYGDQSSSGLIYNLYADRLLQLNLVSESIYEGQAEFYASQLNTQNIFQYGIPTDSSTPTSTRTDWLMFTAGSISNPNLQQAIVSDIHHFASANLNNSPLALSYDTSTGIIRSNIASPAQGSLFSLLALNLTIQNVTVTVPSNNSNGTGIGPNSESVNDVNHHTHVGAIVGAVLGCVIVLGLLLALFVFLRRRHRNGGGQFDTDATIEPNLMLQVTGSTNGSTFAPGTTYEYLALPMPTVDTSISNNVTERELPLTPENVPSSLSNPYSRMTSDHQGDSYTSSRQAAHGHSNSTSTVYPNMSASQREGSSSVSNARTQSSGQTIPEVLLVQQALVNEMLQSEVVSLRRDLERIREDRVLLISEEAPPSYAPFIEGAC